METQTSTFPIRADTSPLLEALSTLRDLLHAGKVPLQFLDRVLNLLDIPGELSRITSITTVGTGITIPFEPADVPFALVTALRTGNLDSFFLEHGIWRLHAIADEGPIDQAKSDLQRTTRSNVMETFDPL